MWPFYTGKIFYLPQRVIGVYGIGLYPKTAAIETTLREKGI
jgi:hypothetical protein